MENKSCIFLLVFLMLAPGLTSQPCITEAGALYGTTEGNESAHVLANSPDGDGFYVGGVKDDSALIVKLTYTGDVIWSRTFDVIAGEEDNLGCLIVDSDENLVFGGIAGTPSAGGTLFLVKYNPNTDNVIWSKEFVTAWSRNYLFDIIEKSPGGNYLLSCNPHNNSASNDDAEILEISRTNGDNIPGNAQMFNRGSSEQLAELILSNGSWFGVGRYTDGSTNAAMRNTIVRLNQSTYDSEWTRLGHVPANATARLYGQDLVIINDEIYSSYHGDPAGTSTTNNKVYVQKTDLDGNMIWIKQFDFPGNNETTFEMIHSDGGIVMIAMKRTTPREIMLIKMNYSGAITWANSYQFTDVTNVDLNVYSQHQLIEAGGYLVFAGFGTTSSAGGEMIIVRADLDGNVASPCVVVQAISVPVVNVNSPVFYSVSPTTPTVGTTDDEPGPEPVSSVIYPNEICVLADTIFEFEAVTICEGDSYQGYALPGVYTDYFTTLDGCDSVHTLELNHFLPAAFSETIAICLGQSYQGYNATGEYEEVLQSANGCDSLYSLTLTVTPLLASVSASICSGESYESYTESGVYVDTLEGPPDDCDTVRTLFLSVHPVSETNVTRNICAGESYEGYSIAGFYTDIFESANGCDSIRNLDLTVTDVLFTTIEAQICEGQSYEGYSESGSYVDTYVSTGGCDSVRTLELTVTNVLTTAFSVIICDGEAYDGYEVSGTYTDEFISVSGCDSIRTLSLTVIPTAETISTVQICEGDSHDGYFLSGTYVDHFVTMNGCDSMRTLHLTVTDEFAVSISRTICEGENFEGYTTSGVYTDEFTSIMGCDSVRTLHLQVISCQVECGQFSASIYGTIGTGEHGQCLVATPEGDGVYLAANKEDSTLIVKIDLQGNWIWTKVIDAVKNNHEIPAGILVDAEGMIAISGTARNPVAGGTLYAIRYDPNAHQILWAREYSHSPNDFNFDIEEKGNGGNYLLANQATFNNSTFNDASIAEIDKNTGNLIPDFQKNYHLYGTETLYELTYYNDYVYGVARYKDVGPNNLQMRHTLVKLDPANGDQLWVKLGHQPPTNEARLYGTDMVMDNDIIMSLYHGDPAGQSTTITEAYIQRTDIDGNLLWVYRYDIPGNNPFGYELIKSGNGYIAYTTEVSTGEHFLFKIDDQGNVLWAKKLVFYAGADIFYAQRGNQLLVQVGNKLVMTGAVVNGSGDADLFIIMTDLDGNLSSPCVESTPVTVTRHTVPNPVFYDVTPEVKIADTMSFVLNPLLLNSAVPPYPECEVQDTVFTEASATICEGEQYNGYTEEGDYVDAFISVDGCDSIHTLHLMVVPCDDPCFDTLTSVYGEPGIRENGLCIEPAPNGDGYFILGRRADGVLLMKFSLQDQLIWTHRIDAVANKREYPCDFIVDSDGMIAVTGMATDNPSIGGTIFLFRFNPATQNLLWSREIPSAYDHDRVHALSQNGPGGNYLISTNPNEVDGTIHNDFQIIEVNPANGVPDPQSHIKKLGNSNYIFDLHRQGNFLYGTGRYSLGVGADLLRHTLIKLDAATLNTIWTKLSHTPQDVDTRIYGFDMVIDNGFIYSGVYGDPDGTSTAQTEIFIQKTTIDGQLIWYKEYDLPLNTDFGYELIKSGNGFVIFANQRNASGELYLFKIDGDGNVLWAREYETSRNPNTVTFAIGGEQLIALGSDLVFTSSVDDIGGAEDILVLHLDSLGFTDAPCVTVKTFSLLAEDVPGAIVYDSAVVEFDFPVTSQAQPLVHEPVTLLPALGCSQSITLMTSIDTTICQGDSFESYTLPGIYQDTLQTADGCDSIRTITLSVTMESVTLDVQLCEGLDYEGYSSTGMYVDTLPGIIGECDTVRLLDLFIIPAPLTHINATACDGESFLGYSDSGMYADTFLNVDGCDSIRTLNLTILPVASFNESVSICEGNSYQGYDVTGSYVDTLIAVNGCDSIRNLALTVLPLLHSEVSNTICEGESYLGYATSGIYTDMFVTNDGCDSVRVLMLTVNPIAMTSQAESICSGDSFEGYETTGTYVDTFISVTGCDSIRTLSLSVGYMTTQVVVSVCDGDSYDGYQETGIYIDTIPGVISVCDTIRTLELTVIGAVQSTLDQVICDEESFEGYNSSGIYIDTLISSSGCDSIRELHLEKLAPIETTILASACDPAIPVNQPVGTVIDTLISSRGCDSIRILTVEGTSVYIPNVFSPNDDGINDVFIVHPYPTDSLDLEYFAIFDRFGDMTYETGTWPILWRGDDKDGHRFQPGVFAYVFIYYCGRKKIVEHGNITLVK
jgi:hypothetical protein